MSRNTRYGLFFISPSIAYFIAFWILPAIMAIYYSLTDWTVSRPATWVGLRNYARLLADPQFRRSQTIW